MNTFKASCVLAAAVAALFPLAALADTIDAYNTSDSNVETVQLPPGRVVTTTYDADPSIQHSDFVTVADPLGHTTTYQYDNGQNTPVQSITVNPPIGQSSGHVTTSAYDTDGNRIGLTTTDGNGHTTTYAYDSNGNALIGPGDAIQTPGNATASAYDAAGNTIVSTDDPSSGNSTIYRYDTSGNPTVTEATITPQGHVTSMAYDTQDNRLDTAEVDSGITTIYQYDTSNGMHSVLELVPSGDRVIAMTYDSDANRIAIAQADPAGNTTIYQYDGAGGSPVDIFPTPFPITSLTYDAVDNQIFATELPEPASLTLLALGTLTLLRRRPK